MRVIHVVPSIADEATGPAYSVVRLCESLTVEGQEITMASLGLSPMAVPPSFLKAFPLKWGPRRLGSSPAMHRWLSSQVSSGKVDILHNHSLWMMPNVYPGQVAKRLSVPLIVSPRGTMSAWAMRGGSSIKKLFWPLLQRPALAATTCFHATAESEYEDIRRLGFRQPVAIIPNGIDILNLPPKVYSSSRTLLFLGRIHAKKGLDMLLPAWSVLQDRFPEWRLQIVGPDNGGYLTQMKCLASNLQLERIEFSGPLFGEQKHVAYSRADLFVLPTYSENFGISVAESLAAGTPAIVSKGAPWSGLEKKKAGWWIDIGIDSLVGCLENALGHSSDQLSEMGQRGRDWMESEYSWNQVGQQMAETYQWVVNGGNKPEFIIED